MPGGNPNHDSKGRFSSGGGGGGGMTGPSAHKSSYAPHAAMVKQMNSQQARSQAATRKASAVPTTHVHHSAPHASTSGKTIRNGQVVDRASAGPSAFSRSRPFGAKPDARGGYGADGNITPKRRKGGY